MELGMTTLATILLLSFLAGSLPFAVLLYLQMAQHREREKEWMRIFSVHSLMIPKGSMEPEQEKPPVLPKPDLRKKLSIPVPMPDQLREAFQAGGLKKRA